ncbi:hypothetical protein [Miltoncostaea marina]|uniref:hypothetical protein n=1 Tax=Miltoncostaea marina TaxID=2843215 RepID=UPI001C3C8D9E|nr:hypothetical protein [Miltoncostaea marina]
MSGAQDGGALRASAARLEEVARRIGDPGLPADELRALAEEALELGARITEQLPAALRPPAGEA